MNTSPKLVMFWCAILFIYLLVLFGIGQVAFTKQYFNDAEAMIGEFLVIKEKDQINSSNDEDTDDLVNSLIQASAHSANGLSEPSP